MSDDERNGGVTQKLNDVIDSLNDLNDNVQTLTKLNVRHETAINEMRDNIRHIFQKIRDLETGNTGRRTGRSRRGNPQNRPAVGGRRTRRRRRKRTHGKLRDESRRRKRTKKRRKSRRKSRRRKRTRKRRK